MRRLCSVLFRSAAYEVDFLSCCSKHSQCGHDGRAPPLITVNQSSVLMLFQHSASCVKSAKTEIYDSSQGGVLLGSQVIF